MSCSGAVVLPMLVAALHERMHLLLNVAICKRSALSAYAEHAPVTMIMHRTEHLLF